MLKKATIRCWQDWPHQWQHWWRPRLSRFVTPRVQYTFCCSVAVPSSKSFLLLLIRSL